MGWGHGLTTALRSPQCEFLVRICCKPPSAAVALVTVSVTEGPLGASCAAGLPKAQRSAHPHGHARSRSKDPHSIDEETEGQRVVGAAGFQPRPVWLQGLSS